MIFDGAFTEIKRLGNFPIILTRSNQFEDIDSRLLKSAIAGSGGDGDLSWANTLRAIVGPSWL